VPTTLFHHIMRRVWRSTMWLPIIFFVTLVTAGLLVRHSQERNNTQRIQQGTAITAEQLKHRLESWVDYRVGIINHFAWDWTGHSESSYPEYTRQAEHILGMFPGLLALNLVDDQWVIRVTVPVNPNKSVQDFDLHDHPSQAVPESIQRALANRAPTRTPLITLVQGQPGFATYFPLYRPDGSLRGFLNGVFVVDYLVDACLSEEKLRQRFDFALRTPDGREAYAYGTGFTEPRARQFMSTESVRFVDQPWILEVTPSPQTLRQSFHLADQLFLTGGLVLAFMLSILLRAYLLRMAELRESRERYRLVVENQVDLVVKIGLAGHIEYASHSFLKTMGLPQSQVVGVRAREFVNPAQFPDGAAYLQRLAQGQDLEPIEFQLKTPDGWCWTSWTGSLVHGEDGDPDGFVGVGRDITQRRELEQQLLQSQKMQAVGQLAGGIAHDFNNIVQALLGYIEFARADLPADAAVQQDLAQATLAAERAAELTRQLLAFSRRQMLKAEYLDLNEVALTLLPMLKRLLAESITLDVETTDAPCIISADRGQVEQILVNLCVNARDAIEDVGRIRMGVAAVELDEAYCRTHSWAEPGSWAELTLTDSGQGMAPELLDKIFEPFFSTKKTGQGTGLGLSTVYGIVKQHNGLIHVETAPDEGSTFRVFLPRALNVEVNAEVTPDLTPGVGEEVILVAEDEDMVRNLCSRILTAAGYRVLAAANGKEALDLYKANRTLVNMALLDVVMPQMGGRELSRILKDLDSKLPILFTSGYDSENFSGPEKLAELGNLLSKPYDRNTLLLRIRETLDHSDGSPA